VTGLDGYLRWLRGLVGSELLLLPGAQVVVIEESDAVLKLYGTYVRTGLFQAR